MRFGELLKLWRAVTDRPLRELSKDIGISHSTLNRIEQGEACDSETLIKLINYFFIK